MTWVLGNLDMIGALTLQHLGFALPPVIIGLVLAIPLGWLANRTSTGRTIVINLAGLLYTVPSLALFVVMPLILGTRILDPVNVVVALTVYSVALLVRTVADALDAVPSTVTTAATAVGYRPLGLLFGVQLPLTVPVLVAGIRVASVSSFSLVAVAAIIGQGALGTLFTTGFERDYPAEIVVGGLLILVLAFVADGLWLLLGRVLAPWQREQREQRAGVAT
jgi:osmoprotectant transport system permease protein